MKKPRPNLRARTQRRRDQRRASKGAKSSSATQFVFGTVGDKPHGELYDDCPICTAMREMDLKPDDHGITRLTQVEQVELQTRVRAIVARDGWPADARNVGNWGEPVPQESN